MSNQPFPPRKEDRMKRSLAWFLGAAVCGLFVEALAWVARTHFTHWVKTRERVSHAYTGKGGLL